MSNQKQRIKINNVTCTLKKLLLGLLQGSFFGPLFFNIYLNEFLLLQNDVKFCNFSYNTTTYIYDKKLKNVSKSTKKKFMSIILWFEKKYETERR